MDTTQMERPDQRALRVHLERGDFQLGVHRGRWEVITVSWPYAIIAVSAANRPGAPASFAFRFQCEGYPHQAVTARPWNIASDAPLPDAMWPIGGSRFMAVFRTEWKHGTCLYLPCDRLSFEGHPHWVRDYPAQIWKPDIGIVLYLEAVHDLLNSSDYHGVRNG